MHEGAVPELLCGAKCGGRTSPLKFNKSDNCPMRAAQGRLATLAGLLGQPAAAAFNTSPMLIRLSAITPSPTQRFMPSSPL